MIFQGFKLGKISRWEKFWLSFCRTYKISDGKWMVYYKHLWGRLYVIKEVPIYFNTAILKEMGACLRFDEFGKERKIPVGEGRVITFKRWTDRREHESTIVRREQRDREGDKEGA
jgi:hypothetical protein